MYGRLHADIYNVPQLLITGVKIQIKLTKPSLSSTCWVAKRMGKNIKNSRSLIIR